MFNKNKCLMFVVLIFSVFLLSHNVFAQTSLDDFSISWNDFSITTVSPSVASSASLIYSVSSNNIDDVSEIKIDASSINMDRGDYSSLVQDLSFCYKNNNVLSCKFSNLVIHTDNANPVIKFFVKNSTNVSVLEGSQQFIIDDTPPSVSKIYSENCNDDVCYFASGINNKIFFEVADSVGTFNKNNLYYKVSSTKDLVDSCDNNVCVGTTFSSCNDGQVLVAELIRRGNFNGVSVSSSDDAGNMFSNGEQNFQDLVCDSTPPVVDKEEDGTDGGFVFSSVSGLPTSSDDEDLPFVNIGDGLIIEFDVIESVSPSVSLNATAESLGVFGVDGSCEKVGNEEGDETIDGLFHCEITLLNGATELGEHSVLLTLTDFAGNKKDLEVKIKATKPYEGEIDDWQVSNPRSLRANKHYLQYSMKPLFFSVSLSSNINNIKLLDAKVTNSVCTPVVGGDGNKKGTDGDIQNLEVVRFSESSLYLKANMRPHDGYDEFDRVRYNCSVDLLTKKGNFLNEEYEKDGFVLTVDFHDTEMLGGLVQKEVDKVLAKANDKATSLQNQKLFINIGMQVCKLPTVFKGVGGVMSTIGTGLMGTQVYKPVGQKVDNVGKQAGTTSDNFIGNTFGQMCQVLACDNKYQTMITDYMSDKILEKTSIFGEGASFFGVTKENMFDPYSSIYVAYMMGCYPAIVYHQDKEMAVDCEYAQCLVDQMNMGFSKGVKMCQQTRQYTLCKITTSGIFNAIPFVNIMKRGLQYVKSLVSDPISLVSTVGLTAACNQFDFLKTSTIAGGACRIQKAIVGLSKQWNMISGIFNQVKKIQDSVVGQSACDRLKETAGEGAYWSDFFQKEDKVLTFTDADGGQHNYDFTCNDVNGCTGKIESNIFGDDGEIKGKRIDTINFRPKYEENDDEKFEFSGSDVYVNGKHIKTLDSNGVWISSPINAKDSLENLPPFLSEKVSDDGSTVLEVFERGQGTILAKDYTNNVMLANLDDSQVEMLKNIEMYNRQKIDLDAQLKNEVVSLQKEKNKLKIAEKYVGELEQAVEESQNALDLADDKHKDTAKQNLEKAKTSLEKAKGKVNDIKNDVNEAKGHVEDTQKEKDKLKEQFDTAQIHARGYSNWGEAIRSGIEFGSSMMRIGQELWYDKKWMKDYGSWVQDKYDFLGEAIGIDSAYLSGTPEEAICKSHLESSSGVLPVTQTASTTYSSTAHVEALKRRTFNLDNDDNNYVYIIHYLVSNPMMAEKLPFSIFLKGPNGASHTVVSKTNVKKGETASKIKTDPLVYPDPDDAPISVLYDQICLKIHGNPTIWFDSVNSNDNVFCRVIADE